MRTERFAMIGLGIWIISACLLISYIGTPESAPMWLYFTSFAPLIGLFIDIMLDRR